MSKLSIASANGLCQRPLPTKVRMIKNAGQNWRCCENAVIKSNEFFFRGMLCKSQGKNCKNWDVDAFSNKNEASSKFNSFYFSWKQLIWSNPFQQFWWRHCHFTIFSGSQKYSCYISLLLKQIEKVLQMTDVLLTTIDLMTACCLWRIQRQFVMTLARRGPSAPFLLAPAH